MQGRSELDKKCGEVNSLLEKVALCDATSPSDIYSNLITALNDLTKSSTLDKPQRAEYRQRLSVALSARIKKAINTKNKSVLIEEKAGLAKVISEVAILQGSGGVFGLAAQKTAVQNIQGLIGALKEAIENPKIEQFRRAAHKDDSRGMEALLKKGFDVNCIDEAYCPLLHWALAVKNINCFYLLLQYKANPNQVNDEGNTPLHMIAMDQGVVDDFLGCGLMLDELINNGVNVDLKNKQGKTALTYALLRPTSYLAARLIALMVEKASPFLNSGESTIYACLIEALNQAYEHNESLGLTHPTDFSEILDKLVDVFKKKSSDVIKTNNRKLLEAELHGLKVVLDEVRLLKHNSFRSPYNVRELRACVQRINWQLKVTKANPLDLIEAAKEGDLANIKAMIKVGVDINCQDEECRTPLYRAASHGRVAVVEFLITQKADINLAQNIGATPLYVAAQEGHKKIVQILVEKNADVNQALSDGTTPLYIAGQRGHVKVVQVLLGNKAEVNQAVSDGATPLMVAAFKGHEEVVQMLLENKAVVNQAHDNGTTPLSIAAYNGNDEIVQILLQKRAEVNQAKKNGTTPLHIAVERRHDKVVLLLLQSGAAVDLMNTAGWAPMEIAYTNDYDEIFDLLKNDLNKKIRLHLFEEDGRWVDAAKGYGALIKYLNDRFVHHEKSPLIRKHIRLFLTTAVHQRIIDVMTRSKPDSQLLQNEKAGLDLMIASLKLIKTGNPHNIKHAMQEIEGWRGALALKMTNPDSVVPIDPPRLQEQSLFRALAITFFSRKNGEVRVQPLESNMEEKTPNGYNAVDFHNTL